MLSESFSLSIIFILVSILKMATGDEMIRDILEKLRIPFQGGYKPLDDGNESLEQGKFEEAISHYTKAIDDKKGKINGYYFLRGYCHHKKDELGKAISDYKEALRIPLPLEACSFAWSCFIQALIKADQTEDAEKYAKRLQSYRLVDMGKELEVSLKDEETALWCYTKAIENDISPSKTFYCERAAHYFRTGKFESAIRDYETLKGFGLAVCGKEAIVLCSQTLYELKRYNEAIEVLFGLCDDPRELFKLAERFENDKKDEEARRCFAAFRLTYVDTKVIPPEICGVQKFDSLSYATILDALRQNVKK